MSVAKCLRTVVLTAKSLSWPPWTLAIAVATSTARGGDPRTSWTSPNSGFGHTTGACRQLKYSCLSCAAEPSLSPPVSWLLAMGLLAFAFAAVFIILSKSKACNGSCVGDPPPAPPASAPLGGLMRSSKPVHNEGVGGVLLPGRRRTCHPAISQGPSVGFSSAMVVTQAACRLSVGAPAPLANEASHGIEIAATNVLVRASTTGPPPTPSTPGNSVSCTEGDLDGAVQRSISSNTVHSRSGGPDGAERGEASPAQAKAGKSAQFATTISTSPVLVARASTAAGTRATRSTDA
mmetsp:Transcript_111684/g.320886  ORF Transcript_111684/g.320886 Transcript_111684/m.320886 type:complete len:292 (-) Transcript_111684:581-1456(-)